MKYEDVLEAFVNGFNQGVASGDFSRALDSMRTNVILDFDGAPGQRVTGVDGLRDFWIRQRPADQIDVVDVMPYAIGIQASYTWRKQEEEAAGILTLEFQEERICRVVIQENLWAPSLVRFPRPREAETSRPTAGPISPVTTASPTSVTGTPPAPSNEAPTAAKPDVAKEGFKPAQPVSASEAETPGQPAFVNEGPAKPSAAEPKTGQPMFLEG